MGHFHVTASGSSTLQTNGARKVLVTVNSTLAGTVTLSDTNGVVAIITNPTAGSVFGYYDFAGSVICNPSTTCEITVNTDNSHGPK